MKDYAIITLGETPTLIHSTRNVAKQICDTAAFIREHMDANSVLTFMDPGTEKRISLCHFMPDIANDLEKILCEYCAKEDTCIHSVIKSPTSHHIVVAAPINAQAFRPDWVYMLTDGTLQPFCQI
jgi:hypothetical protein